MRGGEHGDGIMVRREEAAELKVENAFRVLDTSHDLREKFHVSLVLTPAGV